MEDSVVSANDTSNGTYDCGTANPVSIREVFFTLAQFVFCVIGLVGNTQIGVFYIKKRDKTPSEYIILNLGVVDFIYCLFNVIITVNDKIFERLAQNCFESDSMFLRIYRASQLGLFTFVTNYSFICIFIITLNRYFAVCKPITYKIMCTYQKSYTLLLIAFVTSLLTGVLDTYLIYYFFYVQQNQDSLDTYNLVWFFIRLAFITIDVITMGIVYYKIATSTTNLRQTLARCSISHNHPQSQQDAATHISIQMTTHGPTRLDNIKQEKSPIMGRVILESPGQPDDIEVDQIGGGTKCKRVLSLNNATTSETCIDSKGVTGTPSRRYVSASNSNTSNANVDMQRKTSQQSRTSNNSSAVGHKSRLRGKQGAVGGAVGGSCQRRRSSTENATYALFIISIGFIVFITPYTIMAAWQSFHLESTLDNSVHDILFDISMLVFNGNFISNYYVYLLFNVVFRGYAAKFWKKCFCLE